MSESLVHQVDRKQNAELINKIQQVLSQVKSLEILIPDANDVQNYLLRYPDIIDLIVPICALVKEEFDYSTQVSLEVYHDPEFFDEYIAIEIRQEKYNKNIMKKIKEIRTKYEENLIDKKGWIFIGTDYCQPR